MSEAKRWGIVMGAAMGLFGSSGACNPGSDTEPEPEPEEQGYEVAELSPTDHLVRVSMALRGMRPSESEIAAVEADPSAIGPIVDGYLQSPNFGETIRDLHNEALLVLADYLIYPARFMPVGVVEGADIYALNRSIMESPLRLIEHVVTNDLPYSEIVTADYTLANGHVAAIWGLPYYGDGSTWEKSEWWDERGNAGILSDAWLYQRHSSTLSNANRGRANAISRALLCYDFLSRDIDIDVNIDLADRDAVANAVTENEACASCHQVLDPFASFFRGYYPLFVPGEEEFPMSTYIEDLFPIYLDVPMREPAYFGTAADGIEELGDLIADDPRFSMCAVQRFYAYLHQVEIDDVPLATAAELQRGFLDSGMDAKSLVRAIVLADDFKVSHLVPPEGEEDAALPDDDEVEDVIGLKMARPVQLGQLMRDLTGFRWDVDLTWLVGEEDLPYGLGNVNMLEDTFLGFNVLAGGIDSVYVTRPSHTSSATSSLVLRTLANEAADHVVDADFDEADAGQRKLFGLSPDGARDEPTIRAQLAALHLRLYGERIALDSVEIDEAYTLFDAALAHSDDARRAWKVTLAAMLQDLRIAYY